MLFLIELSNTVDNIGDDISNVTNTVEENSVLVLILKIVLVLVALIVYILCIKTSC